MGRVHAFGERGLWEMCVAQASFYLLTLRTGSSRGQDPIVEETVLQLSVNFMLGRDAS